jgi:hypothetical protein
MCQHFLPRGQYTPECRKGLGQDVLRADEIGIALVIAGDTAKHLSLAVAPIVLTTSGTCSGGALYVRPPGQAFFSDRDGVLSGIPAPLDPVFSAVKKKNRPVGRRI